jgi:hypothetical protein
MTPIPCNEHGPWKLATWPFFIAWNRNHEVFHENKLPYICSMYDTGFKVLSYVWMVRGSLFSWITLWNLCHTLNRCTVAYFYEKRHDSYPKEWEVANFQDRNHGVLHRNKLPYICSMYDTGFKVLSMKINYLAPFKHKHKPVSYIEQMYGSLFLCKTPWFLSYGMKEWEVANFL